MSQFQWETADGVALRELLKKIPAEKLKAVVMDGCTAKVTAENVLKDTAEGIARLASMRAGWEGAVDALLALADEQRPQAITSDFRDMT